MHAGSRNTARSSASALALALLLACCPLRAIAQGAEEYALKAAYLYNFVKYIEWPSERFLDPHAPYTICVVGDDPFGEHLLQATHGKTVRERAFELRRFPDATPELDACHLLFVSGPDALASRVLERVGEQSIVTVGEKAFARSGGIASFVHTAKGFRVELNVEAARRRQLRVSGRLQQVATIVDATDTRDAAPAPQPH
jgi:hypothetical protein